MSHLYGDIDLRVDGPVEAMTRVESRLDRSVYDDPDAVSEVVSEDCPVVVKKVGVKDTFGESGTPAELLKKYGLTAEDIVIAAKEAIAKK